jgi:hypothetical protein
LAQIINKICFHPISLAKVVLIGIEIAIGIAIEIEKNCHASMFNPDPDSDPEKMFEKHQTLKLMTLNLNYQRQVSGNIETQILIAQYY